MTARVTSALRQARDVPLFSLLRQILRAAPPHLVVLFAISVVATAIIPALFAIATAQLVRAVLRVGSAKDELLSADVGVAVGFVVTLHALQQLISPVRDTLAEAIGARANFESESAVMNTALALTGVELLERADVATDIAVARSGGPSMLKPEWGITALGSVVAARVRGLVFAMVLLRFEVWAPCVIGVACVLTQRWIRKEVDTAFSQAQGWTHPLRRAAYLRDLALKSAPAKEIRLFGLVPWLARTFGTTWSEGMRDVWAQRSAHKRLMWTSAFALLCAQGLTFGAMANDAFDGAIDLGAFTMYVQAALGIVTAWTFQDGQWLVRFAGNYVRFVSKVSADLSDGTRATAPRRDLDSQRFEVLSFEDVTFAYPSSNDHVLRTLNLSLSIPASHAIVGANGAGKSTMLKLLCRLYEPTEGRITVDGVDIREFDVMEWRQKLAVVFQDFVRYEASLLDNVAFGAVSGVVSEDAIRRALEAANGDRLLARLPNGLATRLVAGYADSVDLSGGEWQAVALARALVRTQRGAPVLVLDEPTASLDIDTERAVFESLLSKDAKRLTLLISHRLSGVRRADVIHVLNDGRIAESGSHDSLMSEPSLYRRMFEIQRAAFT